MAIRFIAGKPRGGKSLRAVFFLIWALEHTKRNIVTNLPLKLDELQEYCEEKGIKVFVFNRIRMLTRDETDEFYRYRGLDSQGRDRVLEIINGPDGKPDPKLPLDYGLDREDSRLCHGVEYFIDEIHVHLNSRKWNAVSDVALWYASQHAKLGDDVWCITQAVSNVVKQFRDLAQEFRYVRNRRKEKFGSFKVGNNFVERVHLEMVTPGTDREPMETNEYELDADGIAKCYDTSAGVGVAGGGNADKGKDAKGLPLWMLAAVFVLGFAAVWKASEYAPRLLNSFIEGQVALPKANHAGADTGKQGHQVVLPPSPTGGQNPPALAASSLAVVSTPPRQQPVWITGAVVYGGKFTLVLSDGRRFSEDDGTRKRATRNFIEIDGERFWWKTPVTVAQLAERAAPTKQADKPPQ